MEKGDCIDPDQSGVLVPVHDYRMPTPLPQLVCPSAARRSSSAGKATPLAMFAGEPFRVFFPLGIAVGTIGLALWPLFFWGLLPIYPGILHARLMIEGFMGAVIIGFLGTAGPRLLSARHFTFVEVTALLSLHLFMVAAHLTGRSAWGDALFFGELATFLVILGRRFLAQGELPPPNFVLVGCGLLSGAAGAAIVAFTSVVPGWSRLYTFGVLALSQGMVMLPVLGVGVFLFPRFLGVRFEIDPAELRRRTPEWKRQASLAAATAACVMVSFVLESVGFLRTAGALRFSAAALYGATQMPAVLKFGRAPLLGQCIRASNWLLLAGLLWPVFLPVYRVAGLHLVFIGGFMLTTLTVSTRVMLGHSGQLQLCRQPLPFLIVAASLLVIGLAARIGADFMPTMLARNDHLIWASLLCIAAALIWSIRLVPRVFIADTDE
jgi:uncharacterized protein involved in response to NO